ncbi:uncharacterized protein TNCV_3442771 [Trichonephila clavipes]|nr:uncharacterized protein TNCV_3442771 [Trichonephila clavipes]
MDRGTQTPGTRAYSPFMCNLQRTEASDIALRCNHRERERERERDVTHLEVALRFRLATIAIYRSSAGVVTHGMMNAEEKSNICDRLACFNAPHSMPALRIFHSFSGSQRNTYVLKTNCTKVFDTFYQHLKSTSVTLHKAGFL